MKFSDIDGHEEVKMRLREMVDNDRLPHALLLHGPSGTGKLKMARALVTYLHCENRTPEGDSCGRCPSCLQHASLNHVDLHFSFPTLKKNSQDPAPSIDYISQWREFLEESPYADFTEWLLKLGKPNGQPVIYVGEGISLGRELSYTARASKHKTAIVWLPERFQDSCANKLLKLIEEPYPDTKIILVSNNSREILPTIFSRLQRIEMKRLSPDETARALAKEYKGFSEEVISDVAEICEGSVLKGKELLEGTSNEKMLNEFMTLMRLAFQRKVGELKQWSENMAGIGREEQMRFLRYFSRMLRENFLMNFGIDELNVMTSKEKSFSKNFSKFVNASNVTNLINEMDRASKDIAGNANAKIVFFDLSLSVIILLRS